MRPAWLLPALVAVAAGGCGSSAEDTAEQPSAATTAEAKPGTDRNREVADSTGSRGAAKGAVVKARASRFGKILVDGNGRTLYLFTHDGRSKSRCYGDCAKAWPPYRTAARPRAGMGAKASQLGSTRRRGGGRRQVTYRGHPLYYYVAERKAGEIFCQDVVEFGGTWLIVKPSGDPVR